MRGNSTTLRVLIVACAATATLIPEDASARHSPAALDMTKEVVIEGTVAELAWKNPHIYLTLETVGADGQAAMQEVEVVSISVARRIGLVPEAVAPNLSARSAMRLS